MNHDRDLSLRDNSNESVTGSAGSGRIRLTLHGRQAVFSELSYRYPLKLLSPHVNQPSIAIAYVLTYGGGLVSGDRIHLQIQIGSGASLLLLTQGSTKVFKHRPGVRLSGASEIMEDVFANSTAQRLDVHVQSNGLLLLLPEPVTCFSAAAYNQVQTFRLEKNASAVLLDWITSGRMSRAEEWQFSRYYSVNEVWLDKKRIARDVLLLDQNDTTQSLLKERMNKYLCYAMLVLCGSKLGAIVDSIFAEYREISVYQQTSPSDLIWSASHIECGCVIRIAGMQTERVKGWLREHLEGLIGLVGAEALGNALI